MGARRLDDKGLACLASATADRDVVERWRPKIVTVEGSGCLWWTGAISGRFWYASGRVVIAHRFAFALAHDVTALAGGELLGHRCDNPPVGECEGVWITTAFDLDEDKLPPEMLVFPEST